MAEITLDWQGYMDQFSLYAGGVPGSPHIARYQGSKENILRYFGPVQKQLTKELMRLSELEDDE